MWYPNRTQWLALWLVVLLAIAIWLGSADSSAFPVRLVISLLAVSGLTAWALIQPLSIRAQSSAFRSTSAPEQASESPAPSGFPMFHETEIHELTGIHGWLALFCFAQLTQPLFVAWALLRAFRAHQTLADRLQQLPPLVVFAAIAIYGFLVGVALVRRSANAVWHAKFYLQCSVIAGGGLIVWALMTLDPANAGALSLRECLRLIGAGVWLAYFSRSTRIGLTYSETTLTTGPSYKHALLAAVAIGVVIGTPTIAVRAFWPRLSGAWIVYQPTGGGFQVTVPGAPTIMKSALQSGRTLITRALVETPSDAAVFVISYFDLPPGGEVRPDVVLDNVRDATARSPPMKVNDTRAISFEQHPGREYLGDTGQLRIRGRVFLVGRRLYEIRAVTRTHATREQLDAADRFLNSFALPPNSLEGRVAVGQPICVALKTVGHLPEPIDGIVTVTLASGAWIKLRAVDIDHDETTAHTGRAVIKAATSTQMTTSAGRKYVNFTFGPTFVATAWFQDVDWDETRLLAERDYGPSFQFDTKGVGFESWLRRFRAQVYNNWMIPYAATALHGHTAVRFTIHRDGAITALAVLQPSTADTLNKAAFDAINASNPTVPLPTEYPDETMTMTVILYYNEKPPSGDRLHS